MCRTKRASPSQADERRAVPVPVGLHALLRGTSRTVGNVQRFSRNSTNRGRAEIDLVKINKINGIKAEETIKISHLCAEVKHAIISTVKRKCKSRDRRKAARAAPRRPERCGTGSGQNSSDGMSYGKNDLKC